MVSIFYLKDPLLALSSHTGWCHSFTPPCFLISLTSSQTLDIRVLPSVVPSERMNETARIVAPELQNKINKLKTMIDDGLIDNESTNGEWFL
jgi:hypothetical protein